VGGSTADRSRVHDTNPGVPTRQFVRNGAAHDACADDDNVHGLILVKSRSRTSQVRKVSSTYIARAG
jgi:hypothetical protein